MPKNYAGVQLDFVGFFSEGLAIVKKDDKWGFINESDELVIPYQWDEVGYFKQGLARVRKDGQWGWINKSGELVIPCEWDYVFFFSEGLAAVIKEGKRGFINKSGKLISPCQWDNTWDFSEGLARVEKGGKWGKINTVGQLVVPLLFNQDFSKIELFGKERDFKWEGDLRTITINNKFKLIFNSDGLCWLTNSNEEEIILESDTFEKNLRLMEFLEIE